MAEHILQGRLEGARRPPVDAIDLVRPGHRFGRDLIAPASDPDHVLGQPQRLQTRRFLPHRLGVLHQLSRQARQFAYQIQFRLRRRRTRLDVHHAYGACGPAVGPAHRGAEEEADMGRPDHHRMAAIDGVLMRILDHHHGVRPHVGQLVADAVQARHAHLVQTDPGQKDRPVFIQRRDHGVGRAQRRAGDGRQSVERVPCAAFRPFLCCDNVHSALALTTPLTPSRRIIR